MGLFRPSRERRGPDRFVWWKVASFAVGAALGLAGIFMHVDGLVLAAVVVLAVGVGLRLLAGRGDEEEPPPEP